MLEENDVIESLCGIVIKRTLGFCNHVLQFHVGKRRAFNHAIDIVEISLQMFAIVVIQRVCAHDWCQSVQRIR